MSDRLFNSDRLFAVVLIAFLSLALFYNFSVPIFEGPDEDDHFRYVKYLADQRALPVQQFQRGGGAAGHQGWQPPLYYALGALVIAPVNTADFEQHLWRNPAASYQGDIACCGRNLYFHTTAEDFPYRDTTLAVHLVRLLSTLFGLITVAATYALARTIFLALAPLPPGSPAPPLSISLSFFAAALVAFNPTFIFTSALVSNDAPLAAFCALTLLIWAKFLTRAWTLNARNALILGMVVSLALLTKTTALGLIPFSLLVLLIAAWSTDGRWNRPPQEGASPMESGSIGFQPVSIFLSRRIHSTALLLSSILFLAVIALLTGWYFIRNALLYGDPLAYNLIYASAIFPRESPLTLPELFQISLSWLWQTFWGGPTPGDLSPVILGVLTALTLIALVGVGIFARSSLSSFILHPSSFILHPSSLFLAAWFLFIFFAQVQFIRTSGGTDQGRYLFPAIAPFAILFALGLNEIISRITNYESRITNYEFRISNFIFSLLFFLLALSIPFAYTLPAYARPPRLTESVLERAEKRVDANFSDLLALRGYLLSTRTVHRGEPLRVTLYWQGLARMKDSYRVFVHLVNSTGRVAGGKDVIPARGAYATVLWQPGEWIEDTISFEVARDAVPGTYQLEVGLYPFGQPDNRLNLARSDEDRVLVDAIEVAQ